MPGILTRGRKFGAENGTTPVAVVDIGSNSIRLVVYEGPQRTPTPVFNEKVLCGLARGLNKTGKLSAEGVELALASIARFRALTDAMAVDRVDVVATAAVRDAENGPQFVEDVRERCNFEVRVLSGEEEARISAMGVLSGIPEAKGLMGDLGGGSVELVRINKGQSGVYDTLPLGPLRLADMADGSVSKARKIIDKKLATISWLGKAKGQRFFPVGGAWRALARVHMEQSDYPLHVIHQYTMSASDAVEFARFVAKLSPNTLRKIPGVARQRIDGVPYAAYLMQRLVEEAKVAEVVFSAYGLREGCLYDRLPAKTRKIDPLLASCWREAERMGRATADGEALFDWMSPLFPDEESRHRRLRLAACHLADIGWSEHPDYRGEMVFERILRHPSVGTDHPGRVFMALSVASRHSVLDKRLLRREAGALLDRDAMNDARSIGLAMRLGYTLSGGVISLLQTAQLHRTKDRITLILPQHADILVGDVVQRRFMSLAKSLECDAEIDYFQHDDETKASGTSG